MLCTRKGKFSSFFPANLALPMVAPEDLGEAAAKRLMEPADDVGLRYVEGPRHYTPGDVAVAFSRALGRPVDVAPIPPEAWEKTFLDLGFSAEAAKSYSCMTRTVVDDGAERAENPERGSTTLQDYIRAGVHARGAERQ